MVPIYTVIFYCTRPTYLIILYTYAGLTDSRSYKKLMRSVVCAVIVHGLTSPPTQYIGYTGDGFHVRATNGRSHCSYDRTDIISGGYRNLWWRDVIWHGVWGTEIPSGVQEQSPGWNLPTRIQKINSVKIRKFERSLTTLLTPSPPPLHPTLVPAANGPQGGVLPPVARRL